MELRFARPTDYRGILDLVEAYQIGNLTPAERGNGFLSARFSLPQVAAMAEDLGIVVALERGGVVGILCASRFDWSETPPIVQSMAATFPRIPFEGRPLSDWRSFLYGPVCIDRPFRGQGLLRKMGQCLNQPLKGRYDVGAVLVSENNPHSLEAHTLGLGMKDVGAFTHNGQGYRILAYRL